MTFYSPKSIKLYSIDIFLLGKRLSIGVFIQATTEYFLILTHTKQWQKYLYIHNIKDV